MYACTCVQRSRVRSHLRVSGQFTNAAAAAADQPRRHTSSFTTARALLMPDTVTHMHTHTEAEQRRAGMSHFFLHTIRERGGWGFYVCVCPVFTLAFLCWHKLCASKISSEILDMMLVN